MSYVSKIDYPGFFGGIIEVHGDVNGLDDATKCVDGDEENRVCLYEGVIHPQHG